MWAAYREWNRMTGFSTIWRTYKPAAIYTVRRRINRINIITINIRYPTLAHNFASCWPIFKQNYFTTRRAQTSAKADSMHSSSIVDIVLDCILASYSHFDCDPTPPTWPLPILKLSVLGPWLPLEIIRELSERHFNFVMTLYDNFKRRYSQNDFDFLTSSDLDPRLKGHSKSNRWVIGLYPTIL